MIIKIFAAIILLMIVVGISYVKSTRSAKKEADVQQKFDLEKKDILQQKEQLFSALIRDSSQYYVDSLTKLDIFYRDQIDSLNSYYKNRENALLADLRAAKKGSGSKKANTVAKNDTIRQKISVEFTNSLQELPNDLTAYEKRVARNEIIFELSQKYTISPDSLEKLIK